MIDREQVYKEIAAHAASIAPAGCFGIVMADGSVRRGTTPDSADDVFGFYIAVERADGFSTTLADLMRMDRFGAAYIRAGVVDGKVKWFRADRLGRTPRGEKFLVPIWPPEAVCDSQNPIA